MHTLKFPVVELDFRVLFVSSIMLSWSIRMQKTRPLTEGFCEKQVSFQIVRLNSPLL